MKYTNLEKQLMVLEPPCAISKSKLKEAKELNINIEDLHEQIKDINRLSAILQLFVSDYEGKRKLFTEKEESTGENTEIKILGKIYDSPYMLPEIPIDSILYYSRTKFYPKAPETARQLYNDIIIGAKKEVSKDFLRNMLTSPDLDIHLIFGNTYEHLTNDHINTECEKITRVISEQKPGASITTIDIPSPKEYTKLTGKEFIEDEYYDYIDGIIEKAKEKVNDNKLNEYIKEALVANIDKIMFWYGSNNHEIFEKDGGDANEISIKYDIKNSPFYEGTEENPEYIGSGYDLRLREKYTTIIKIPLRKDKFSPLGINAKTLYPDILDKSAVFSGKEFSLEEANIIGRDIAIENTIRKRRQQKAEQLIKDIESRAERVLTQSEKDLIRESDEAQLTKDEIDKIVQKVDETYQDIDYMTSPMYKAFAHIKEEFTDKKIVTFFGNFKKTHRIEITPETFANRKSHKFHRCVIIHDIDTDNIRYAFFQTERAAGFDGRNKITFDDLTDQEKELFKKCIKYVKNEVKSHNKETTKNNEDKIMDKILNGPPEIPQTQVQNDQER